MEVTAASGGASFNLEIYLYGGQFAAANPEAYQIRRISVVPTAVPTFAFAGLSVCFITGFHS